MRLKSDISFFQISNKLKASTQDTTATDESVVDSAVMVNEQIVITLELVNKLENQFANEIIATEGPK